MHLLLDGPITFDTAELTHFGLVSQYRNTPAWRLKIEMLGKKKNLDIEFEHSYPKQLLGMLPTLISKQTFLTRQKTPKK